MSVKMLDKQLLRSLLDGTIPFYEVMNTYNIRTVIADLPPEVYAFVYVSRRGNCHLVMNGAINAETQFRVFCHEVAHIVMDLPQKGYVVGLDMQRTEMEEMADWFAGALAGENA